MRNFQCFFVHFVGIITKGLAVIHLANRQAHYTVQFIFHAGQRDSKTKCSILVSDLDFFFLVPWKFSRSLALTMTLAGILIFKFVLGPQRELTAANFSL